jgi:acyl-coenzyme A synthetase/AMP-(fatty) acid ligase
MATRQTSKKMRWHLLEGFKLHKNQSEAPAITTTAPHLLTESALTDTLDIIYEHNFLLGARHQDMINIGGKRASLADLNRQLLVITGIDDGIVFIPNEKKSENRPAAFVVSTLTEQDIRAALSKRIDTTLIPRPIISIQSLPRNNTGKLTQQAITQLWQDHQHSTK